MRHASAFIAINKRRQWMFGEEKLFIICTISSFPPCHHTLMVFCCGCSAPSGTLWERQLYTKTAAQLSPWLREKKFFHQLRGVEKKKSWKIFTFSVHFCTLHCFRIFNWQKITWKGFSSGCNGTMTMGFLSVGKTTVNARNVLKWKRTRWVAAWLWFVSLLTA